MIWRLLLIRPWLIRIIGVCSSSRWIVVKGLLLLWRRLARVIASIGWRRRRALRFWWYMTQIASTVYRTGIGCACSCRCCYRRLNIRKNLLELQCSRRAKIHAVSLDLFQLALQLRVKLYKSKVEWVGPFLTSMHICILFTRIPSSKWSKRALCPAYALSIF